MDAPQVPSDRRAELQAALASAAVVAPSAASLGVLWPLGGLMVPRQRRRQETTVKVHIGEFAVEPSGHKVSVRDVNVEVAIPRPYRGLESLDDSPGDFVHIAET